MAAANSQINGTDRDNDAVPLASQLVGGKEHPTHTLADSAGSVIDPATSTLQSAAAVLTGAVNEAAPASDTASSGLNGRLQRIAQNLTTFFGVKTTAVTALGTGGSGVIGWLSQIWERLNARMAVETTNTPAAVTLVASTSNTLKTATAARIRLTIYNPLATTLYVRKAASAATVSAGGFDFVVRSGEAWVSDPYEWAGEYRGICATAGDVNVSESV